MRRIAIVGAGQSGLQLGLGLLDTGYDVTMITNRTADEIRQGKVMSSQCMFHTALQTERDLGLNFWEEQCPAVEGIGLALVNPENGGKAFEWSARLERYAQSVDQRVKMPYWMEEFERRGGQLVIQDVGIEELEQLANDYELVLLAAGKGEVVKQFERDDARSVFDKPRRALALTYVKNMNKWEAANEFCKDRGWEFHIWTEQTLQEMGLLTKPMPGKLKKPLKKMAPYRKKKPRKK